MTTIRRRGTFRPQAAARREKAAQRTPLPPRTPKPTTAEIAHMTSDPVGWIDSLLDDAQ